MASVASHTSPLTDGGGGDPSGFVAARPGPRASSGAPRRCAYLSSSHTIFASAFRASCAESNAPATVSGLSCSNNADAWIGATAA